MRMNFPHIDRQIAGWMERHAILALRISMAVVFIWFGLLKPLGTSPANDLVAKTVYWVDPTWFIPFLGWWEVLIGVCMLWRPLIRLSIFLLALQMPGTLLPMFLLPEVCFVHVPWSPTLEGQYIIKNLVLIAAAMAVGGTVVQKETSVHAADGKPAAG
jgi:uncharacterized membrane protein YkgB